MKDLENISEELAYEIVNHTYDEVRDPETIKEIILKKLKEYHGKL